MTLSKAQIAKLSPAQRKAREKAIEYKREYHAKKRKESLKSESEKPKGKQPMARKAPPREVSDADLTRLEILFVELKATRKKERAIIEEIDSIVSKK